MGFYFEAVPFIDIPITDHAFSVVSKKSLPNQSFQDFSPGSFIVLSFAIRFVIHKMVTLTTNKIITILYFILHVTSEFTE